MSIKKSIRTLFLTGYKPYPPIGGSPLRNWQNINIMMKFGPVGVFSVSNFPDEVKDNSKQPPGVELWNHYNLNKIPIQRSFLQKIEWWLSPRKHYLTDSLYTDSVSRELDRILKEFKPDLVIFAEPYRYCYLPIVKSRGCCIILDEHNVEAPLFRENHPPVAGLKSKLILSLLFNKMKSIERDFIRQADQVWMCSDNDAYLLRTLYGQFQNVRVVPNAIDVAHYDSVRIGKCPPPGKLEQVPWTLFFAATFTYTPNEVAAELLIDQIFPRLQEIYPNCRLILAGKFPTPHMLEAAKQNPRIVVTGLVEDIRPYMSISSVVITPLLQGGGTRLKILEAFAAGRPVVSTAKGAEGLRVRDGKHLLIRDSIDDLVAGVCELWGDPYRRQTLAQNAYELVKSEYSWEAVCKRVEQSVQELLYDGETSDTLITPPPHSLPI